MAAVALNPNPGIVIQAVVYPLQPAPLQLQLQLPNPLPNNGPACHSCGTPSRLYSVAATNPNGNAGRHYYACGTCQFGRGWVTWADALGVDAANPECYCHRPSRRDRAGVYSSRPNRPFWTCATGHCTYYSELDGDA